MKIVRQFGAFVLILLWSLVPAMACAVPDAQMTASERACCIQMHSDCGDMDMDMPSSQGCCHKDVQADHVVAMHQTNVSIDPSFAIFAQLSIDSPPTAPQTTFGLVDIVDTSPPESPGTAITVLRI